MHALYIPVVHTYRAPEIQLQLKKRLLLSKMSYLCLVTHAQEKKKKKSCAMFKDPPLYTMEVLVPQHRYWQQCSNIPLHIPDSLMLSASHL